MLLLTSAINDNDDDDDDDGDWSLGYRHFYDHITGIYAFNRFNRKT